MLTGGKQVYGLTSRDVGVERRCVCVAEREGGNWAGTPLHGYTQLSGVWVRRGELASASAGVEILVPHANALTKPLAIPGT